MELELELQISAMPHRASWIRRCVSRAIAELLEEDLRRRAAAGATAGAARPISALAALQRLSQTVHLHLHHRKTSLPLPPPLHRPHRYPLCRSRRSGDARRKRTRSCASSKRQLCAQSKRCSSSPRQRRPQNMPVEGHSSTSGRAQKTMAQTAAMPAAANAQRGRKSQRHASFASGESAAPSVVHGRCVAWGSHHSTGQSRGEEPALTSFHPSRASLHAART